MVKPFQNSKMEKTFRVYHYSLATIGVYIFSRDEWNAKIKNAHQIFNCFISCLVFIFTTGFIITGTDDVIAWIEGICIWITGVIAYMSIMIALVFRNQFRSFLEEMAFKDAMLEMPFMSHVMKNNQKGMLEELKDLVLNSQNKLLRYCCLLLQGYSFAVSSTAIMYICDAVLKMILKQDGSLRILAYEMWFPWKLDNFKIYLATFIFHAYAGLLCAMVYPTVQSTIVLLMGQIIRQLKILTFILVNLDELILEITTERKNRWQYSCTALLAQCVKHYIKIKRFSNRLNVICRPFYLALILNACILVCVCSVKIAISNKLSPELVKYYMHEFFFILMVLLFCSLGQQIHNECENLEQAVTEKWYIFDRAHKKNILIFSMALRQNMPIYIFGTIPLSLPTFTWFIKTGMSFFTLVMSVLEE